MLIQVCANADPCRQQCCKKIGEMSLGLHPALMTIYGTRLESESRTEVLVRKRKAQTTGPEGLAERNTRLLRSLSLGVFVFPYSLSLRNKCGGCTLATVHQQIFI